MIGTHSRASVPDGRVHHSVEVGWVSTHCFTKEAIVFMPHHTTSSHSVPLEPWLAMLIFAGAQWRPDFLELRSAQIITSRCQCCNFFIIQKRASCHGTQEMFPCNSSGGNWTTDQHT